MDRVDQFLMDLAKDEKEDFQLSINLDNKIEETLKNLHEPKKKLVFSKNRNLIAMAATIAFVIFIGIKYFLPVGEVKGRSNVLIDNSMISQDLIGDVSVGEETIDELLSQLNQVSAIDFKSSEGEEKTIENKEEIKEFIQYINKVEFTGTIAETVDNYDYEIHLKGNKEYFIGVKGTLISVNGYFFKIKEEDKEDLRNFIMNYNR